MVLLIWLTIGLSAFTNNNILFIIISIVIAIIGIMQFIQDKKELKRAKAYVRVVKPVWEIILDVFVPIILIISLQLIPFEYTDFLVGDIGILDNPIVISIIFVGLIFSGFYHNFNNSIRSFESGIKLPGINQSIIEYGNIESLSRENENVYVLINQKSKSFEINNRDFEDMDQIIKSWREHIYNTGKAIKP